MENTFSVKQTKAGYVIALFKSSLIGIIVSLILILMFAIFLKIVALDGTSISYVNQGIKVVSILFALLKMNKHVENKYIFHGMLVGVTYTIFSFVIFSILNGHFNLQISLLTDVAFSILIGAICALITRTTAKRR